jgi:hypothetical protein
MLRRAVMVLCLFAFGLGLGCGGGNEKDTNPDNLSYSKEGPPKRDGTPGTPGKKK